MLLWRQVIHSVCACAHFVYTIHDLTSKKEEEACSFKSLNESMAKCYFYCLFLHAALRFVRNSQMRSSSHTTTCQLESQERSFAH
uniref:Uncharacterized protein n=1 Tax=Anguilla anguilla TaxID=7936 RepID=A0A0E9R1I5_ANGAN